MEKNIIHYFEQYRPEGIVRDKLLSYTSEQENTCLYWSKLLETQGLLLTEEKAGKIIVFITSKKTKATWDLLLQIPETNDFDIYYLEDELYDDIQLFFEVYSQPETNHVLVRRKHIQSGNKFYKTIQPISSKKDIIYKSLKEIKSLSGRIRNRRCLLEGSLLVERALNNNSRIEYIVVTSQSFDDKIKNIIDIAKEKKISVYEMNQGLLSGLTDSHPTPNIVCCMQVEEKTVEEFRFLGDTRLLIIDSISNPDNLGMILRTADAGGVDAVVLIGSSIHYLNRNVVRGARGAIGKLPIFVCEGEAEKNFFKQLLEYGFQIIGMSARAENEAFFALEYKERAAFIVGNESNGIRSEILEQATDQVRIPMAPGQSSLNVAISAGLVIYELVRK